MKSKVLFDRISSFVTRPIHQECVFFIVAIISMYVSHFIYEMPESGIELSYYPLRLILITLSTSVFIAWLMCVIIYQFQYRSIKYLLYAVTLFLMTIDLFLFFNFQTILSPWILLLLKETNTRESSEFLGRYLFTFDSLKCYGIITLSVTMIWLLEKEKAKLLFQWKAMWIKGIFHIALFGFLAVGAYLFTWSLRPLFLKSQIEMEDWLGHHGGYSRLNTPTNLLFSIRLIQLSGQDNQKAITATINAMSEPSICREQDSLNVILVIGESFSKRHTPLYGYYLNTTPNMSREKEKGNLIAFNDAVSPYNMTTFAVKNILSTNSLTDHEPWYSRPLFSVIFKKAGFYVSIWDNQRPNTDVSSYDYALGSYMYAQEIIPLAYSEYNTKTFTYDLDMVQSFIHYRAHHIDRRKKRNLHIFHLSGQHANAAQRFPQENKYVVFKESDIQRDNLENSQRQVIADYDNATYYNDQVIMSLIRYFSGTPSVLIYLSDHGEEIYDYRNFIGRSQEKNKTTEALQYQYEIPFVIWYSDSYLNHHPQKVLAIRNAANKPILSDDVAHTLINIAGISSSYYYSDRDFLSPKYFIKHRIVQDHIDYDERTKTTR